MTLSWPEFTTHLLNCQHWQPAAAKTSRNVMDLLVRDVICLSENYFTTEPNLHVTPLILFCILQLAAWSWTSVAAAGSSAVNCGHTHILTAFRKKNICAICNFLWLWPKGINQVAFAVIFANYPQQSKGLADKNWTVQCMCRRREKMRPNSNCILY